jgi:uncharacterized membrane protein YhdT
MLEDNWKKLSQGTMWLDAFS